ncbi:MAG: hypothetical protein JWQ26_1524 [Modestobacter sp.]|nr:hypothetical protein [Modestobacter sp.]
MSRPMSRKALLLQQAFEQLLHDATVRTKHSAPKPRW